MSQAKWKNDRAERDHWIRLFMRLEKAVCDEIERNPDADALRAAWVAVMKDAVEPPVPTAVWIGEPETHVHTAAEVARLSALASRLGLTTREANGGR